MTIKVRDLKPNPYRRIENYPIRREKVEALKNSIRQTSFWDNVVARKNSDGYQIAYGHHRLVALKELGIKEVDIPVKDLDDKTMLKIMANENMEDWAMVTSVVNETVMAVRDFLFRSRPEQKIAQKSGEHKVVSAKTIKLFLGENWPIDRVQDALEAIGDSVVAREAMEVFDVPRQSKTFRRELKSEVYSGLFPKSDPKTQVKIANKVKERILATYPDKEVSSSRIKAELYETVKEIAKPEIKRILERRELERLRLLSHQEIRLERGDNNSIASASWHTAWAAVMGLRVTAADLNDTDVQRIERMYISKIEKIIETFRGGKNGATRHGSQKLLQ